MVIGADLSLYWLKQNILNRKKNLFNQKCQSGILCHNHTVIKKKVLD